MLKEFFDNRPAGEAGQCPEPDSFFRWSRGDVRDTERDGLTRHAAACGACADKISALEGVKAGGFPDGTPDEAQERRIRAAIREMRNPPVEPSAMARRIWFFAFVAFMALSFVWSRYFMQMLVLAIVCAAKWLIDTRARHLYVEIRHRGGQDAAGARDGAGNRRIDQNPRSLLK